MRVCSSKHKHMLLRDTHTHTHTQVSQSTTRTVKQIFVHGDESMASYTSGRKRLYRYCAASYTPRCT